jgi:hypothetical protein
LVLEAFFSATKNPPAGELGRGRNWTIGVALEEASLAAGLSFTSGGEWASTTTSNVASGP